MKRKMRITILMLVFGLIISQKPLMAYAETEGTSEGQTVMETQEETASSDASLSSLKIAQASLHPEFSSEQLTYTASVPYEVTRIALTAQTSSPEAKKIIRGTSDLEVGENVITVEVTAEDGTVRQYHVFLTREESTESISESESLETESQITETEPIETEPVETDPIETEFPQESDTQDEPETTQKNHGGMQTAPSSKPSSNKGQFLSGLLKNKTSVMILLIAAGLISVLVILIILLNRNAGDDEDYDDEEEQDDQVDEDGKVGTDDEEVLVSLPGEEISEPLEKVPTEMTDEILDFDELEDGPEDIPADRPREELVEASDDLDDDFEMVLEDDDDFDFLDF